MCEIILKTPQRDASLDNLKFVLIFLVILGHTLEFNISDKSSLSMFNFIYLFHMPLFVILSGICFKMCSKKSIGRLMETYIVFQCLYLFCAHFIMHQSMGISTIISPYFHLWYIVSLIWWRLITVLLLSYPIIFSTRVNKLIIVVSTIFCACLMGLINNKMGLLFSFSRTVIFYPFFIIGYFLKGQNINYLAKKMKPYAGLFLLIVFFAVMTLKEKNYMAFGYGNYNSFGMSFWEGSLARIILIILSFIISISVYSLLQGITIFSMYGRKTMSLFIFHWFFICMMVQFIEYMQIEMHFMIMLALSLIITIILCYMVKFKYIDVLLNPISALYSKFSSVINNQL